MKLFKNTIFMSLVLLVGACSKAPEPLIKEQVQLSSKEDYEYLKETSKAAPLEIDLYTFHKKGYSNIAKLNYKNKSSINLSRLNWIALLNDPDYKNKIISFASKNLSLN